MVHAWFITDGWAYFLVGFCLVHTVFVIGWFRQQRQRLDQLHWRLDSMWSKVKAWHDKVDRVTDGLGTIRTDIRRMTGEFEPLELPVGGEDFDDSEPEKTLVKKKKRRSKKKT